MERNYIWKPISFDPKWNDVNTTLFDGIFPSWERKRDEFSENPETYKKFLDQLKRKQAIDTGIIERMYDLREGVTETFIKEGFVESYLQHGDSNIETNLLMAYLRDNFEAIDFIFAYVKEDRSLSTGFIKELHSLITRHQDKTEAKDQFGHFGHIPLRKGEYKTSPNNPQRDGVIFEYCPPEQTASEMDNLIEIANNDLSDSHIAVKAAFIHHAFVQIHPFQDGNGRIARLLASLILIKEGLFPFTLDRKEKLDYIRALEEADEGKYQKLVNLFMNNQIKSMEKALNWRTIEPEQGYNNIIEAFNVKFDTYKKTAIEQRNKLIAGNMLSLFTLATNIINHYSNDLCLRMNNNVEIKISSCKPGGDKEYFFSKQIFDYAKTHDYFLNTSFSRAWIKTIMLLKDIKQYNLIFTIHHYGYDNNTFAIGSFISYDNFIDIPSELPPLTFSSEINVAIMREQIEEYIEQCFMIMIAYMYREL